MLFGGGRALDWSVSIRQMDDGDSTYIVFAKYKDECRLKMFCLEGVERRLKVERRLVDGGIEIEDWMCEKNLASLDPGLSPTKILDKDRKHGTLAVERYSRP